MRRFWTRCSTFADGGVVARAAAAQSVAQRHEAELRLRFAEQDQQQRSTAEQLRIARDLHNVLAHSVTVVGIHAGAAAENLKPDPHRAHMAVEQVRTSGREAMADLRSIIALLRAENPATTGNGRPGFGVRAWLPGRAL